MRFLGLIQDSRFANEIRQQRRQQPLWTAAACCGGTRLRFSTSLRTTGAKISDASKIQGGSRQQAGSGKRQQGCCNPCGEPARPSNPGSGSIVMTCKMGSGSSGGGSRFGLRQPAAAFIPQPAAVVEASAPAPAIEAAGRRSATPRKSRVVHASRLAQESGSRLLQSMWGTCQAIEPWSRFQRADHGSSSGTAFSVSFSRPSRALSEIEGARILNPVVLARQASLHHRLVSLEPPACLNIPPLLEEMKPSR